MAHHVQGFIGDAAKLGLVEPRLKNARVIGLVQGYGLLLLTSELHEEATANYGSKTDDTELPGYFTLARAASALGSRLSANTPVAYIETEYFGGLGTQAAVVWEYGQRVVGPNLLDTDAYKPQQAIPPISEWPINRALRYLGVEKGDAPDEFDALGLGKGRSNDEWIHQHAKR